MNPLSREYPSDLANLAGMRSFIAEACRQAWGPGDYEGTIHQLLLALTEAATNIMLHAYAGEKDRPILLVVEGDQDQLTLTMYHHGAPFDPDAVAPPDFDGSREGGFGVYLIKQLVDEVYYFRDDLGRGATRLVKKRTKAPETE
jgi:anti-sigma regulatory factor (Ser/Thr protein kinase)